MLGRHLGERRLRRLVGQQVVVAQNRDRRSGQPHLGEVHDHEVLEVGQPCADGVDLVLQAVDLAAIAVAVGGEQHTRADLPEAVDDAHGSEVG